MEQSPKWQAKSYSVGNKIIPHFMETECHISDFRRDVDENSALLGYYAASGGNFLPTFRDNLSASS